MWEAQNRSDKEQHGHTCWTVMGWIAFALPLLFYFAFRMNWLS
jgi:hypothetical protein